MSRSSSKQTVSILYEDHLQRAGLNRSQQVQLTKMKLYQLLALVITAMLLPTNYVNSSPFIIVENGAVDESTKEVKELDPLSLNQDLVSSVDNPDNDNEFAGDEPAGDGPGGDGPGGDEPAGDGPGGDGPAGDGPGGDEPAGDGPGGDGPAGDGPGGDGPAGDGPAGDGPGGDGSGVNGPEGDGPGGDGSEGQEPDYDEVFVNSLLPKEAVDSLGFFEGDIRLTAEQRKTIMKERAVDKAEQARVRHVEKRAVLRESIYRWPNGRIPYTISARLSSLAAGAINSAIAQYTKQTCIRFVPRRSERDYVLFTLDSGCYSYVGRTGGQQQISIGRGCESKGIIMHEMFHALGRFHEQSRPDRDLYITVNRQNIRRGTEINFEKLSSSEATTNNIGYDFSSLMHYNAYSFSRNGNPTITPRTSGINIRSLGQRSHFTSKDLAHVNALYCGNEPIAGTWSLWSGWSSCSATCQGGTRSRSRTCQGGGCVGAAIQTQPCNNNVQCYEWGPWAAWAPCSTSCSHGFQTRFRNCVGVRCQGNSYESRTCKVADCPGSWSNWKNWGECSESCGKGEQVRTRSCSGGVCYGSNRDTRVCVKAPFCPQESNWGQWSTWSSCSASCGFSGRQSRTRSCLGSVCESFPKEVRKCNFGFCPSPLGLEYGLGSWREWTPCSRSCGGGFQTRRRSCDRPRCYGTRFHLRGCNYDNCATPTSLAVSSRTPLQVNSYEHISCLEINIAAHSNLHTLNQHSPFTSNIVDKCILLAAKNGFQTATITGGYCNSVAGELNYKELSVSHQCQHGTGSLSHTSLLAYMDVYRINTRH